MTRPANSMLPLLFCARSRQSVSKNYQNIFQNYSPHPPTNDHEVLLIWSTSFQEYRIIRSDPDAFARGQPRRLWRIWWWRHYIRWWNCRNIKCVFTPSWWWGILGVLQASNVDLAFLPIKFGVSIPMWFFASHLLRRRMKIGRRTVVGGDVLSQMNPNAKINAFKAFIGTTHGDTSDCCCI